jgi:Choline/Carnitine o-acyltransferase
MWRTLALRTTGNGTLVAKGVMTANFFLAATTRKEHRVRLPVPLLRQTIDAYLESLEPFLEDLSKKSGRSKEDLASERKLWADDFEKGVGKLCQDRLLGQNSCGFTSHSKSKDFFFQNLMLNHHTIG